MLGGEKREKTSKQTATTNKQKKQIHIPKEKSCAQVILSVTVLNLLHYDYLLLLFIDSIQPLGSFLSKNHRLGLTHTHILYIYICICVRALSKGHPPRYVHPLLNERCDVL